MNAIARTIDPQLDRPAIAANGYFIRRNRLVEYDRIIAVLVIVYQILTKAAAENIRIVIAFTSQPVIARPADQRVIAVIAIDTVVAPAPGKSVGQRIAAIERDTTDYIEGRAAEIEGGEFGCLDAGQLQQEPGFEETARTFIHEPDLRIGADLKQAHLACHAFANPDI